MQADGVAFIPAEHFAKTAVYVLNRMRPGIDYGDGKRDLVKLSGMTFRSGKVWFIHQHKGLLYMLLTHCDGLFTIDRAFAHYNRDEPKAVKKKNRIMHAHPLCEALP
jgi:hypothetical protein